MKQACTLILTTILLTPSPVIAAPETPKGKAIGITSGIDDAEFYYAACNELLEDARTGQVTSDATPQCGHLTPLHMAIIHQPDLVTGLLKAGAEPETIGADIPALHLAAQRGEYGLAHELLAEGASPHSTLGDTGWTTLHSLYVSGRSGDENGTTRKSVAEHLIAAGVDVDSMNEHGMAPLHVAALGTDGVVELLDLGADAELRDNRGVPIEYYAALKGDTISAERLRIAAGDPVGVTLEDGQTKQEWVDETRRDIDVLVAAWPKGKPIYATQQGLSFHAHDGRCHDACRREFDAAVSRCARNALISMTTNSLAMFGPLALGPAGIPRAIVQSVRGFASMGASRVACQRRAERRRDDCWEDCDASVGLQIRP